MDENDDMKREIKDLEEEIEEMQDNFRFEIADLLESPITLMKTRVCPFLPQLMAGRTKQRSIET